ncbi:GTPase/DUF3482 domain-containing protein [Simplicispira hankyongi]|uniref:DUF3482 domain-containing protein n=1 Tax=Simplicispira hankyongi TaxID=2315688 RepID=A0A398CB00_9BURK|nr:GTPase/DUF3482 domain-containing protein [Simplicispira hankyongi]RID99504.1 DUF3482 domain-containing protein [Simplicispira hankyongi]
MSQPIEIAVVGHTNVGKTSLLRTLTRKQSFGEVSDRPGTTRHVERIDLHVDGRAAVRFFDTPGLEDAVALQHYMAGLPGDFANPVERVRAFLAGPEAHAAYEQEAKVLRKMLEVDAAVYVIDCRQDVLPKYRSEIELLCACARPVMPVLNFIAASGARADGWRDVLAGFNLHVWMQFDAVAPFVGAERQLFQDLCVLLRPRQAELQAVVAELDRQAQARRVAAATLVARLLVHAAAQRRAVPRAELEAPAGREQAVAQFRKSLAGHTQQVVQAILGVYGFRPDEADLALSPWTSGRWQADLFHPQTLQDAGRKLGTGAAVGAAVGLAADVALAGMSLGAATALGAAVGGVVSQGWSQLPRKLRHKLQGVEELTLEDAVLLGLADSLLRLVRALERRGHAATARLAIAAQSGDQTELQAVVQALAPARGFPEVAKASALAASPDARREALGQRIASLLLQALVAGG